MKAGRNVKSVIAAAASLAAFDMGASAADNQLNIHVYLCSTSCVNLSSLCQGDITLGTYGTPATFSERLPAITGYVYGYYANSGAYINFYDFVSSDIRHSPARLCANNYSGNESAFLGVVQNGCPCNGSGVTGDVKCVKGTYHHNNSMSFYNDFPSYNASNECALYYTISNICCTMDSTHRMVDGVTFPDHNAAVVRDTDYLYEHETNNPYAYGRMVMVHEIGHLYGVDDHYGDYAGSDSVADCIWGDNAYDYHIASTCTTCSVCHSSVVSGRDQYHHT